MQKKIESLSKIFEEEKILFAYLFGSRARGDFHDKSDVDIAIYPGEGFNYENYLRISGKISDKIGGLEVQIIDLTTCGSEVLRFAVFTEGKLVYEKNVDERLKKEIPIVMISKEWMWRHYKNVIKNYSEGKSFTLRDTAYE